MSNESRKLPDYIIRKEERKAFTKNFKSLFENCANSLTALAAMDDLNIVTNNIEDIKKEAVDRIINERLSEIERATIFTSEGRKRARDEWEAIRNTAKDHIANINLFMATYPDAHVEIKDGNFVCLNFEELIVSACRRDTPKSAYKHFELIQQLNDSIDALQKYETENGFPSGSWENILIDIQLAKNPADLINNWIWQEEKRGNKNH